MLRNLIVKTLESKISNSSRCALTLSVTVTSPSPCFASATAAGTATRILVSISSSVSSTTPQFIHSHLISLSGPTYQIWSANTSLGKTLVSAGLSSSFLLSSSDSNKTFIYIKPIQTGFPRDSDSRFLFTKLPSLSLSRRFPSSLFLSHSILSSSLSSAKSFLSSRDLRFQPEKFNSGMYDLSFCEENRILGENNAIAELVCKTLFAWEEAVSPHLAAERESGVVGDSEVVETLGKCLRDGMGSDSERREMEIFCVVETAGGVASPGPSGSLQCDLYRQVNL